MKKEQNKLFRKSALEQINSYDELENIFIPVKVNTAFYIIGFLFFILAIIFITDFHIKNYTLN
jgi:hypothetical protein